MRFARTNDRGTRRVTLVALTGTTALAIVGGSVLSATAATGSYYSCLTTNGSTMLVDASGAGNGLVNLGSSNGGLLGVAVTNGLSVGLLSCTAVVSVGGTAPTAVATLVPTAPTTTLPAVPTTAPTVPTGTTPTTTTPTSTTPATTGSTPTGTPTGSTPASTDLAAVKVTTSTSTVYPAAKGYSKSRVTFSVKGLTAVQGAVKVTGKAVLKKGTKVVKTWKITSTTKKLSWNGRIGKKVKPGVYTLTVKVRAAGSAYKTTTMKVRVSAKHLVTKTVAIEGRNLARSSTAVLPARVAKAFALGKVTVRVRTVAHVTGAAKLVIAGDGVTKSLVLKDGTHTTKPMALKKGFDKVRIAHRWKKGAATLTSFRAIFTYKQLV